MANQCSNLKELYNWCLNQHYQKNDHHPEHFSNPYSEMPEIAKMELTCDLLGSALGVFKKQAIPVSLSECRFLIESEKWRHWIYAIKEHLPVSSNIVPQHDKRWKTFPDNEKTKLNQLFEKYKEGFCPKALLEELKELDSVQYYLEDFEHHKSAVYEVWKQIPEFKVPGMKDRIKHHDDDKYDPIMILGYTAEWCFNS